MNGIFEIKLKNAEGKEETWTIDLKKKGEITKGGVPAGTKADITLSMADETFTDLASGKVRFSFFSLRFVHLIRDCRRMDKRRSCRAS